VAKTIFLDIDGVITDHALLHADFTAQLGEVLAPALGGTVDDWGRANAEVFPDVFAQLQLDADPTISVQDGYDIEDRTIVLAMCDWLGIPRPNDHDAARLGRDYTVHVRRNTRALFPAAPDMVRTLAESHHLHMATGNPSWVVEPFLEGIGLRHLIGFPCGPDLIGVFKRSDLFHAKLFEAVGVSPRDAVVVDDVPQQVANARAAGASTILVTREPVEPNVADAVVSDPSQVAAAVAALS
jgi:phosphoglycolate phosphatase-like HAD superfamily hydrolase